MADDWIKLRKSVLTHPRLVRTMSALKADRFRTLGGIISAWCLIDEQTEDGRLDGFTASIFDEMVGMPGIAQAMADAGWLVITAQGIEAPNFIEHNGQTAKRRAQDTVRKMSARKADKCPHPKQLICGPEKRREEKRIIPPTPKGEDAPFSEMTESRRATFQEWLRYKAERKQAYKPTGLRALIKEHSALSDQDLATAVQSSMAKNYSGIFPPKTEAATTANSTGLISRPLN